MLLKKKIRWSIIKLISKILRQPLEIQQAKNKVWTFLLHKYNYKVAYGPFKGMHLNKDNWWSKNDMISQTLGVYEKHILEKIIYFSRQNSDTFIDVGAADGYFVVGMTYAGIFKKSFAFEISSKGRKNIYENAVINKCSNKIIIKSEANYLNLKKIIENLYKPTILIDIEGLEYNFFQKDIIDLLKNSFVICELHPWLEIDGYIKQKKLLSDVSVFFDYELITRETYNPNQFKELDDFGDDERLLAFSEKRGKNTNWLVLTPKK